MPSTIVVGGQYGSEGKGKVVALCAAQTREPWVVRCGGPNSGHTVWINGRRVVLRQVPTAAGHPAATLFVSAGCAVDEDLLLREQETLGLPAIRLVVDPRAVLVSAEDQETEREITGLIGSTGSGTGASLVRRMRRTPGVKLAGGSDKLRERVRVEPVAPLLHGHIDKGGDVIVEGTQGFGLSLLHGPHYPHVTARDTTAAGFASEVGLSPRDVDHIVMVVRTFPIRVSGNSGPLADEISWEVVRAESGAPDVQEEYTSVTGLLRRVGRFDLEAVKSACRYNRPTELALMGLDRLDHQNAGAASSADLTAGARQFIETLEAETNVRIGWVGTGFRTADVFNRSNHGECSRGASPARQLSCASKNGQVHCGDA
jgi:adenylosuccinate synthase